MRRKKAKPIEFKSLEALSYVGDFDDLVQLKDEEIEAHFDKVHMERIIHFLPADELSVLLLRHIGFKPVEIVSILSLKSIGQYYKMNYFIKMHLFLYSNLVLGFKEKDL